MVTAACGVSIVLCRQLDFFELNLMIYCGKISQTLLMFCDMLMSVLREKNVQRNTERNAFPDLLDHEILPSTPH